MGLLFRSGAVFGLLMVLLVLLAAPALAFTDVPPGHPFEIAITELASRHIIEGYGDGRFGPQNPLRRAQFAKLIVGTVGLELPRDRLESPFADVPVDPNDPYPSDYVTLAARWGITQGFTPTTFGPNAYVTRAQVITMVVRAADRVRPGLLADTPAWWTPVYDVSDPTHGANIAKAGYSGILEGIGTDQAPMLWNPSAPATRGEAAQILFNLSALWGDDNYSARPGTVINYGDSKGLGAGDAAVSPKGPAKYLALMLSDADTRWTAGTPMGMASKTAGELAALIDATLAARTDVVSAVLCNVGTNDTWAGHAAMDGGQWVADYLYILDAMKAKWPGVHCYLVKVWRADLSEDNTRMADVWIPEIVAARPGWVHLGPDERAFLPGPGGSYMSDAVHLNALGYWHEARLWKIAMGL